MGSYSGSWKTRATAVGAGPRRLSADLDPTHAAPQDDQDPAVVVDTTGAPGMPPEWDGTQYVQGPARSAYADQTPDGHGVDIMGFYPGVSREEAQALANFQRSQDYGELEERRYTRPRMTEGETGHTELVSPENHGDSPDTVLLKVQGVGAPNDPDARHNRAIRRWHDRPIDMHMYEPEERRRFRVAAKGATGTPVPAERGIFNSPFPSGVPTAGPSEITGTPLVRRAARGWGEHLTDAAEPSPTDTFGLGTWGL